MYLLLNNMKKKKMSFSGSITSLLGKLHLRREEVVIKVNGKIVPDDSRISGSETVEIIKVIFGG
ncbi:TPA: MoaD/ThiS family protein [Candidatus Micrarchaeota archaeon]|nr:MoaD/ThiS family protein [Candidatus Micrarchaeota archaeon]